MLVLTRKKEQSIMIGDNIEVIVVSVRGEKVQLGFKVADDIPVHRKEVYDEIREKTQLKNSTVNKPR